jgi:hypothetical protein
MIAQAIFFNALLSTKTAVFNGESGTLIAVVIQSLFASCLVPRTLNLN